MLLRWLLVWTGTLKSLPTFLIIFFFFPFFSYFFWPEFYASDSLLGIALFSIYVQPLSLSPASILHPSSYSFLFVEVDVWLYSRYIQSLAYLQHKDTRSTQCVFKSFLLWPDFNNWIRENWLATYNSFRTKLVTLHRHGLYKIW